MLTGKRPFNDIKGEPTVILEVAINGKKPDRPHPEFPDALWNLLLKAWDPEHQSKPSERPSIQQVMNQLKEEASASYLSGLLIGHEVRSVMPPGGCVHLIGAAQLTSLYTQAIEACGGCSTVDDEDAAALGLAAIGRRLSWS